MPIAISLRVTASILAVATDRADHGFVTIPVGSIIAASGDLAEPGFHSVVFSGRDLLAFARDIRERTESK